MMKIQPIQNIQHPKLSLHQRVQKAIAKSKSKWNKLVSDVYIRHGYYWDENCKEWKRERDLPSCITRPSETDGVTIKRIRFYPEDVEKMKSMSIEEEDSYRERLVKNKHFWVEDY